MIRKSSSTVSVLAIHIMLSSLVSIVTSNSLPTYLGKH